MKRLLMVIVCMSLVLSLATHKVQAGIPVLAARELTTEVWHLTDLMHMLDMLSGPADLGVARDAMYDEWLELVKAVNEELDKSAIVDEKSGVRIYDSDATLKIHALDIAKRAREFAIDDSLSGRISNDIARAYYPSIRGASGFYYYGTPGQKIGQAVIKPDQIKAALADLKYLEPGALKGFTYYISDRTVEGVLAVALSSLEPGPDDEYALVFACPPSNMVDMVAELQHSLVHETGHLVANEFLGQADPNGSFWKEYADLRKEKIRVDDLADWSKQGDECFAEDFMIAMPDKLARTPARSQWAPITPEMKVSFRALVNDCIKSFMENKAGKGTSATEGGKMTGVAVRDSKTSVQFRGAPYYTRVFITRDSEVTLTGKKVTVQKDAKAMLQVFAKASRVYEATNFSLQHTDVAVPEGDFSVTIKLPSPGLYAVHKTWDVPGQDINRSRFPINIIRIPAESQALKDASGHWARRDLNTLYSLGTITGYPDGTIRPNRTVTRAEFVKMLCGAMKKTVDQTVPSSFSDMAGHWASAYVALAEKSGWVSKSRFGSTFLPDKELTRGDMAWIMARVVDSKDTVKSSFADVPDADQAGVASLVKENILKGMPDGTFGTEKSTTRAEAATVLSRLRRWRYEKSGELIDKEDQKKSGYVRKS